jgi:hypothetical protein
MPGKDPRKCSFNVRSAECWNRLPESVKTAEKEGVLIEKAAQRKTRITVLVGDKVMGVCNRPDHTEQ